MIDPNSAELIVDVDPPRSEWLAARRTGIGGSDISTLVGLNPYRSVGELFLDKTGQLPDTNASPSEAAEMGTLLEPVLRERFARVHALTVERAGTYRSVAHPHMLVNPDGLCSDGAGLEIKTCSAWSGWQWADGAVADHAELQAQWGMAVTGLDTWHVAVLIGGQRNAYRTVDRDNDLIATLVDVSTRFWREHVATDIPPDWDGSPAATAYLTSTHHESDPSAIADIDTDTADALIRDRDKTVAAEKAAAADADAVKNRARSLLGDAERLMCEQREIATWRHTGPLSERALREQHPELATRYTTTVEHLDTRALAADHPEVYRQCRSRVLRFTT